MYTIDSTSISNFRQEMLTRGGAVNAHFAVPRSIKEPEDIKNACYTVYEAGVPFQTGKQAYKNAGDTPLEYQLALNSLADKIYNFFNHQPSNTSNTEANFDKFHAELCNGFRALANADRHSKGVPNLTYGNAQKLVNMTFKYLTTFADYSEFSDLFEHCHMPIDKNILAFFHSIGVPGCTVKFSPKKGTIVGAYYKGIPWTKILLQADYEQLVRDYRRILSAKHPGFTMLHLEYCIWAAVSSGTFAPAPSSPLPGTKTAFYM